SSRRRHTRFTRDWSSNVCSSDLLKALSLRRQGLFFRCDGARRRREGCQVRTILPLIPRQDSLAAPLFGRHAIKDVEGSRMGTARSEERRVGKDGRWRGWAKDGER